MQSTGAHKELKRHTALIKIRSFEESWVILDRSSKRLSLFQSMLVKNGWTSGKTHFVTWRLTSRHGLGWSNCCRSRLRLIGRCLLRPNSLAVWQLSDLWWQTCILCSKRILSNCTKYDICHPSRILYPFCDLRKYIFKFYSTVTVLLHQYSMLATLPPN